MDSNQRNFEVLSISHCNWGAFSPGVLLQAQAEVQLKSVGVRYPEGKKSRNLEKMSIINVIYTRSQNPLVSKSMPMGLEALAGNLLACLFPGTWEVRGLLEYPF